MKRFLLIITLILLVLPASINAQSELVGYWKFDESSGQTIIDSSGYSNNGNIVNLGTGVIRDIGKYGNDLNF